MEGKREAVARMLSLAHGANIVGEDEDLADLIRDYFVSDDVDDSDVDSDDESCEEDHVDSDVNHLLPHPNIDDHGETDTPLVVLESQTSLPFTVDVDPDQQSERKKVQNFSCKCKLKVTSATEDTRSGCCSQFTPDEIMTIRQDWSSMTPDVKDNFLCGLMLGQSINRSEMTCKSHRKEQTERKSTRTTFNYMGRAVCREMFKFLLVISQNLLTAVKKHVLDSGATERKKSRGGRNKRALTAGDVERVVRFVRGYAETHALAMPGQMKSINRTDLKLLPSSHTKVYVHEQYRKAQAASGQYTVSLSSFKREWQRYCPEIYVTRPMTDLCWVCQKNNTRIQHSDNLPLDEKAKLVADQNRHLADVTAERAYYQSCVENAKQVAVQQQIVALRKSPPCSRQMPFHYSFDFAQQVHIPSNPLQPGPMYFLVPRKCGIFGVCCEAIPQQVNFLIDEGMCSGKGSNSVISYLDYFFRNFGLGEDVVHLHCDNCAGQNKNQHLLHYLAWRVMTGQHKEVHLHFMLPGHTKFAPDWCFGLLKRKFRVTHVSSLSEMRDCVKNSTRRAINLPQLVGDESGNVFVPTFDWHEFFKDVGRPFTGIKSLQHFRFRSDLPGRCTARAKLDGLPTEKVVLTALPKESTPKEIPAPGLGLDRQEYLFQNIRQFVKPGLEDTVCPPPKP